MYCDVIMKNTHFHLENYIFIIYYQIFSFQISKTIIIDFRLGFCFLDVSTRKIYNNVNGQEITDEYQAPDKLSLFYEDGKEIFEKESILQRAFFGDIPPEEVKNYIDKKKGVLFQLKDVGNHIFEGNATIPALSMDASFDTIEVLNVALMIVRHQIQKLFNQELKIVVILPTYIKQEQETQITNPIFEVFQIQKQDNRVFVAKELVANVLYQTKYIKKLTKQQPEFNAVILNMQENQCEFNYIKVKQDLKDTEFVVCNRSDNGSSKVDSYFLEFISLIPLHQNKVEQYLSIFKQYIKNFSSSNNQGLFIELPYNTFDNVQIKEVVNQYFPKYNKYCSKEELNMCFQTNTIHLKKDLVISFFDDTLRNIENSFIHLIENGYKVVLLNGEFAQNSYVYEKIIRIVGEACQTRFGQRNEVEVFRMNFAQFMSLKGANELQFGLE